MNKKCLKESGKQAIVKGSRRGKSEMTGQKISPQLSKKGGMKMSFAVSDAVVGVLLKYHCQRHQELCRICYSKTISLSDKAKVESLMSFFWRRDLEVLRLTGFFDDRPNNIFKSIINKTRRAR